MYNDHMSQNFYSKKWKQCKYPRVDEQINKICYIYTVEYYSTIKRKETEIHIAMCKTLKTLSKVKEIKCKRSHIV